MNTRIYVKNLNGKNHGSSMELGGGFTMSESAKGTRHMVHRSTPTFVLHNSHTLTLYKLNARTLSKKKDSPPFKHSLSTSGTLFF